MINMTVCFLWATKILAYASGLLHPNRIFWITLRVSYTRIEFFGQYRGSLIPKFQAFHLRRLTAPFLLRPTHIDYFSFYVLNYESLLDVVPKTTQLTFTKSGEQPYRAHECNDDNSFILFQWLTHNYISYNSNNHVNTSINMH